MNEARYLQALADATDAFLRLIGVDADYLAQGGSYFTVETHIRHLDEARAGDPIATTPSSSKAPASACASSTA